MKFRPCIDLHDGCVKQIVGSTLKTTTDTSTAISDRSADNGKNNQEDTGLTTNFSTTKPAREFAQLYQRDGLLGGHVIMLGSDAANIQAATQALQAWPGRLQIGGGINESNAKEWLEKGASHVIVTSAVFAHGQVDWKRLQALVEAVGGKERLVLDLSCRKRPPLEEGGGEKDDQYYVVTDKWQKFTNVPVTCETLQTLSTYCDEFLVHGVDVEGKQCGILPDLVELLGKHSPIPVTYAGGVRSLDDLDWVEKVGQGQVDCTVGSALDIFGGTLAYDAVVEWHQKRNPTAPVPLASTTST
jgi:phosphoribosylformimino-5-aminoimidazole carboxamide ribotide isomerase